MFKNWLDNIEQNEQGIDQFTRGYEKFGFQVYQNEIVYREWAPNVREAYLVGDFSNF